MITSLAHKNQITANRGDKMTEEQIKIKAALQEALSFLAKLDGSKDDILIMEVVQAQTEIALYFVNKSRNS
jgi:hypothetical protein